MKFLKRNAVEEVKKEESKEHQSKGLKSSQFKKYPSVSQKTLGGDNLSKDFFMNVQTLNSGIGLNLFEENIALTPGESKSSFIYHRNKGILWYWYSYNLAKMTLESPIWEMHYIEELSIAQEVPPINGFDEMVTLTNEGKIWNFPIDNEQGIR